jgi:hypothetical protein
MVYWTDTPRILPEKCETDVGSIRPRLIDSMKILIERMTSTGLAIKTRREFLAFLRDERRLVYNVFVM